MKAVGFKVFDGRSIYSHKRCIKLTLDLEDHEKGSGIEKIDFGERLIELLPELLQHRCSVDEENGFVKVLSEGMSLQHICGHIGLALQNMVGINVCFCTENKPNEQQSYTVYEYKYENVGIEAGAIAVDMINALLDNRPFELGNRLERLRETLNEERLEPELRYANNAATGTDEYTAVKKRNISPLVAVTGTNGKTTTTRLIGYALAKVGRKVGMTTTGGIYINGSCIYEGDTTGYKSALSVLSNHEIDAAVLETARGGLIRDGLAYELADVAVITNITDDHLGLDGVETLEDLAKVKALVGEAVKKDGYVVINGDDPMSITILSRMRSKLIIFTKDKNNGLLEYTIRRGGYGVYTDKGKLVVENSDVHVPVIDIEDIAITMKGALRYNIENAMAACGALVALNIDFAVIEEALRTFECNEVLNPGRFNTFDIDEVLAVLDYGHNIDGYKSVLEGLSQMQHRKLIGVIGVPGDRLDRNIVDVGKIAGSYFDHIIIKEDKDKRGRRNGEVAELLQKGVSAGNFSSEDLEIILEEEAAFRRALDNAAKGDIVIIFFEDYEPLLKIVKDRINRIKTNETCVESVI